MCGLNICLFIAFLAISNVRTSYRDPLLFVDDEHDLKTIPIDWNVEDPSIITDIDVINVNVEKINSFAFKDFINLEGLQFNGRITAIEDNAFTGLNKLKSITLNGVRIQHIGPKVFHNLNSLTSLEIAGNEFRNICVTNLTMLNKLDLYSNNITELRDINIINLKNLKFIDLSRNKVRAITSRVFAGCPNLINLNLNVNQITNIEAHALTDLSKLEVLHLSHNNLTTVTVLQLPNLRVLDLSNNKITFLKENTLMQLPELTEISLNHNLITRVDKDYFVNTLKLVYLNLGFNLIKELYLSEKLEKLRRVILEQNQLQSIKLSATTQRNINYLGLSDNNLTHLDESFQHLTNLQELLLNKNKIKSFPLCIPGSLTNLFLSHNELHEIALDKFCGSEARGRLLIVDLSSNQFTSYNLTHSNKSLQETQPDLNEIDLSRNFLNADLVKQIKNFDLRHVEFLKIEPQLKAVVKVSRNGSMNGDGNTTWIIVTSAALAAVGVFAVIAAILFVCKQRRRTNPNRNINHAVMLDELYDDVRPARADDDVRSSPVYHYPRFPIYDSVERPHIYHYPRFRPRYDEVRPVYLAVLPDIPGPQCLEQEDNEPEENHYEEIK